MRRLAPQAGALAFSLLVLAGLEWGARLWTQARGSPFQRSLRLLERDAVLGWRQRAGLDTAFLGAPVTTDRDGFRVPRDPATAGAVRRVLVLGPSSTFGWGVADEQTYARVLEDLLNDGRPGGPWRVVNGGEIGYSSWQGARLLEEVLAREPRWDWVVFAYGVNDLDRHRFFWGGAGPDREVLAALAAGPGERLADFLGRSSLLTALSAAAQRLRGLGCRWVPADGPPSLRVPPEDFLALQRALVQRARAAGARPLLLTTATAYPASSARPEDRRRARAALDEGVRLARAGEPEAARRRLGESLALDADQSEPRFWLSALESAAGRCAEAEAAYDAAREAERFRLERDVRDYDRALSGLAREARADLVDLAALVRAPEDFIDPVHFSAAGHRRIAGALLARMRAAGARAGR